LSAASVAVAPGGGVIFSKERNIYLQTIFYKVFELELDISQRNSFAI
jgi:hypothetical protein